MNKFKNKAPGIINFSDLKTFKGQLVYWSFFGALICICIICVLPTVWTLFTGFKNPQEVYTSTKFFPEELSWELIVSSIKKAFSIMDAGRASLNTLFVSIVSTVFSIIVCGFGGYVLSRLKPKGSQLVFSLILWTMMMPHQIRIVPLFISYISFPFLAEVPGEISLLNTYWPMILEAAADAFVVMLFKNNFDTVSMALVESAKLDGCGNGRIFFDIMVPLSKPIIMYVAISKMKNPWGNFLTPYLTLTEKALQTLPIKLFILKSDLNIGMNTYLLCLIIASIPGFIIFACCQKYIMGGINVGGVKG